MYITPLVMFTSLWRFLKIHSRCVLVRPAGPQQDALRISFFLEETGTFWNRDCSGKRKRELPQRFLLHPCQQRSKVVDASPSARSIHFPVRQLAPTRERFQNLMKPILGGSSHGITGVCGRLNTIFGDFSLLADWTCHPIK